jgi:hypothetical protein
MRQRDLRQAIGIALIALMTATSASADASKPTDTSTTFGSRTDKPDGSSSLTMGRTLPTAWETKVGTDVTLAPTDGIVPADTLMRPTAPDRSTGAIWGTMTMPGLQPLGFDKTSVNARIDGGSDTSKVGATLSRSMPVNPNVAVTLQNDYSMTQTLGSAGAPAPSLPMMSVPSVTAPASPSAGPVWSAGETVLLNVNPSGTTFSAGAGSSTADGQWHNKLSVEQTLFGPLKVTTSVEDAGSTSSRKSITAGFKRVW